MSENTKPNNERPADLAVQDSVGGMARRLLNPAHLRDLAGRSVKTLREQGAEQLWRDVKFRVGLAMHHDDWRHRADIPLRRELKAQRAAHLQGPKISIIVPLYNTPAKLFDEMLQSVVRQTYTNWELVLVDASDADKRLERRLPKAVPGTIVYEPIENGHCPQHDPRICAGARRVHHAAGPRRRALPERAVRGCADDTKHRSRFCL